MATKAEIVVNRILGKRAKRYPAAIMNRFKGALGGSRIPMTKSRKKPNDHYLEAFAKVCAKNPIKASLARLDRLLEMKAPDYIVEQEAFCNASRIARIALAAGRARLATNYMEFLSITVPDVIVFLNAMEVFANRQEIDFRPVDPGKIEEGKRIMQMVGGKGIAKEALAQYLQENLQHMIGGVGGTLEHWEIAEHLDQYGVYAYLGEGVLLPFSRMFSKGGIRGYHLSDSAFMDANGFTGQAIGTDFIVLDDTGEIIQHELQHVFHNVAGIGGERKDGELRAKLASLEFSDKSIEYYKCCPEEMELRHQNSKLMCEQHRDAHRDADIVITKKVWNARTRNIPLEGLPMRLLEREIKRFSGLSYNRILEPFMQ